jgi:hypothetical protein
MTIVCDIRLLESNILIIGNILIRYAGVISTMLSAEEEMGTTELLTDASDLPEHWKPGAKWCFDRQIDQERIAIYNQVRNEKQASSEVSLSERRGRKVVIEADFMAYFPSSYRVKKEKYGSQEPYFELLCPGDDRRKRARSCSYGAKFRWEEGNDATLIDCCDEHGPGCMLNEVGSTLRCKEIALLCAANERIYEALHNCKDQSKETVRSVKAEIEGVCTKVIPSEHTVKR